MTLDDSALLVQWKRSYKRGFAMEAPLAILGFVFAAIAWWLTHQLWFLVGGILLVSNWPWTIFGIMPTNNILMAMKPQEAGPHSRTLIRKWNQLLAVLRMPFGP